MTKGVISHIVFNVNSMSSMNCDTPTETVMDRILTDQRIGAISISVNTQVEMNGIRTLKLHALKFLYIDKEVDILFKEE